MENGTMLQSLFSTVGPRRLSTVCLALSAGLVMNPVMAVITNPSIQIHGRAPTATGTLYALMPGGRRW